MMTAKYECVSVSLKVNTRIDTDLRKRVLRLLAGERRIVDLIRIFLDLRDRSFGRPCFREVGDFVAHRNHRSKGLVTQTAQYLFVSLDVWSLALRNKEVSMEDLFKAGEANLQLATDELILAMNLKRPSALKRLKGVQKKWDKFQQLNQSDSQFLEGVANKFVWRPVFSGAQLYNEVVEVLKRNKIINKEEVENFESARTFIILFALTNMHGCQLRISDKMNVETLIGFKSAENYLCAFLNISFADTQKPILVPIALLITDLLPSEVCHEELLNTDRAINTMWEQSIEINENGLLGLVR